MLDTLYKLVVPNMYVVQVTYICILNEHICMYAFIQNRHRFSLNFLRKQNLKNITFAILYCDRTSKIRDIQRLKGLGLDFEIPYTDYKVYPSTLKIK